MTAKRTYEGLFLLDAAQPDFEAASRPVRALLERYQADVLSIKPWDERRLAYEIQRATVGATGAVDRGTKNARFVVLRECACPAVLVEMGFMSSPTEEANLSSAAYQTRLAKGIATGISRYDACLPPN